MSDPYGYFGPADPPTSESGPASSPFADSVPGPAQAPCPYCGALFTARVDLEGHLVEAHGQKAKKQKKVKPVKTTKGKYKKVEYNPAKGFFASAAAGLLVVFLVALIAQGEVLRIGVPAGIVVMIAAKFGFSRH